MKFRFKIDGQMCETGADLIAAIGSDKARAVNAAYDLVGMYDGSETPQGHTDESVAESDLLSVDLGVLARETGVQYRFDHAQDAYVPVMS